MKWFRRAAEQGFAPAQVRLGLIEIRKDRALTNITEGVSWLRKAADQKETFAMCMIGRQYEEGWGLVETNYTEAAQWYARTVPYGNAFAQFHLGRLLAHGRGVPRDPIEALKWFELVNNNKGSYPEQTGLIVTCNQERGDVIGSLKAAEIVEAQRRAAAFVPDTSVTNNYWFTTWSRYPYAPHLGALDAFFSLPPTMLLTNKPPPLAAPDLFVEVPVRIEDNRPYVSVKVNGGKSVRLLFDSGCHMTYFREKTATKLKLKSTEKMRVGNDFVDVVEGVTLEVGKASFAPPKVGIDFHDSFRMLSPFEDGILGADFLQNFVVELDYRKGRMRLRDPFRYKYTGPGDYLLIQFLHGTPILDAKIIDGAGRAITATFLIDTGFTGTLLLEEELWKGKGVKDSLGRTLSGSVTGFKGRRPMEVGELNGFQLGHYYFPEPRTLFREPGSEPAGFSGLIGGNILRRFTVIFHYGRQQLILIPNGLPLQPAVMQDSASQLNK